MYSSVYEEGMCKGSSWQWWKGETFPLYLHMDDRLGSRVSREEKEALHQCSLHGDCITAL